MTSPGISIRGLGENSCSINSIGKSGSRSCGVNGARVPGCSGGSMGPGNDGRTLTQTEGIWLSASRNLECSDMGETTITERPAEVRRVRVCARRGRNTEVGGTAEVLAELENLRRLQAAWHRSAFTVSALAGAGIWASNPLHNGDGDGD